MTNRAAQLDRRSCPPRGAAMRAFTLMELLVVMGIIVLLAGVTALTYRAVAKDAKLSSAKNTVMAVLDHARSLAMRDNTIVVVAFRPRLDNRQQYIEAVLAKWTGESVPVLVGSANQIIDRYVPITNVEPRRLPVGVQIAGPSYGDSYDDRWITLSHLPAIAPETAPLPGIGEAPGAVLGVMYSPKGQTIFYNARTDAQRVWIDFDNNYEMRMDGVAVNFSVNMNNTFFNEGMFELRRENDEPAITLVPYLAVIDDEHVRELYDVTQWDTNIAGANAKANRNRDYTQYISESADRIHFNRFTGVAMK